MFGVHLTTLFERFASTALLTLHNLLTTVASIAASAFPATLAQIYSTLRPPCCAPSRLKYNPNLPNLQLPRLLC